MRFPSDLVTRLLQYQLVTIDSIDGGCEFDPVNNLWSQLRPDPKTVVSDRTRKMTVHATFQNHTATPVQRGFARAYLNSKPVLNDTHFDAPIGAFGSQAITFTFDALGSADTSFHYLHVSVWSNPAIPSRMPYQLASVTEIYAVAVYV
jgi:hypothetical protein